MKIKLSRRYQVIPDVAKCQDAGCFFDSRGELAEDFAAEHAETTGHVVCITNEAKVYIGPAPGQLVATRQAAIDVPAPPASALRLAHFAVPCVVHDDGLCVHPPVGCNSLCWTGHDVLATTVTADVTCKRCKRTVPYLDALAQEAAAR